MGWTAERRASILAVAAGVREAWIERFKLSMAEDGAWLGRSGIFADTLQLRAHWTSGVGGPSGCAGW